ncbi:helix-turn-helix domain-containing protein [Sphingobacterium sp. SRCM116780]|uniref:helix-turn-helix domain-containing protein n=1 Tax=Sphingobacterium sp. SRCM116780 TaxID=2907623 RepID=UPI001F391ED1|nr:AraC family transcriptional regulator [Sphingobacterium sp. SRCM116780]UIR56998.1 helix-turn-helix domain-containing protein [Sphingobacterium sp. SRCM116780]
MLTFYKPKNQILATYIEGYYFLRNNEKDFSLSYYTFPNNFQIVSCAAHVDIALKENQLISKHNKTKKFISTFTYNYFTPIQIDYYGKINEITIYFKPLGLNHFVSNLEKYHKKENFISFLPFLDFQYEMQKILSIDDIEESRDRLEKYWIGKLLEINVLSIYQIITMMDVMNIGEISDKLKISRQYLYKTFKAYTGKSPVEFKRIQRFRNALEFPQASLTETGLQNLFYDQSHFIKEVQKFTNILPKVLFKNVKYKTANPWLII